MRLTFGYFTLLVAAFSSICAAEPTSAIKDVVEHPIVMKKASKNGLTSFAFSRGDTVFYRLVYKDVVYQRSFASGGKIVSDIRVTEYDLDLDGKVDAIQIGEDDRNFSAYIVLIEEGKMDIEALPANWKDGSEYPYDTFISYVKKRKGIK